MELWTNELKQLITERALRRGRFTLASGQTSDHYLDLRRVTVSSRGNYLLGRLLHAMTQDRGLEAIGGPATGAIPLAAAAVAEYGRLGLPMEGFWVRPLAKEHGTGRRIEGALPARARVALVEDVATSGGSLVEAALALREEGHEVQEVIVVVDRLAGAERSLFQAGIPAFRSLFTLRDFGIEPA